MDTDKIGVMHFSFDMHILICINTCYRACWFQRVDAFSEKNYDFICMHAAVVKHFYILRGPTCVVMNSINIVNACYVALVYAFDMHVLIIRGHVWSRMLVVDTSQMYL